MHALAKVSLNVRPLALRPCYMPHHAQHMPHSRLYARNTRIPFRTISAVIYLAHKYHVQDLLDQVILALEEHFTYDFTT